MVAETMRIDKQQPEATSRTRVIYLTYDEHPFQLSEPPLETLFLQPVYEIVLFFAGSDMADIGKYTC
jgi:hypothetical protein